jgi:UDPglucose 6-dehydrogenase/GDP-mannose 6-dehydrogenase
MNVSVVGSGYVGLVTATCLAERGHRVVCVDIDEEKVARINDADAPIHEPGLDELLRRNVEAERLRATTDLRRAVRDSRLSMIAVGTPYVGDSIDLTAVEEASRQIGAALGELDRYHTVVVKSTVVPGTTDDVVAPLLAETSGRRPGDDFGVGMNPEFLREGEAVGDFMDPDRLVLGGIDDRTHRTLDELYRVFPEVDRLFTTNKTAELIKYAANSLLATLISFSNEIGNLAAELDGVDVVEVMEGVHLDGRLSPILEDGERIRPGVLHYLEAGCGFGGSCFPKDVRALVAHARQARAPMEILDAVVRVNERQPRRVVDLLRKHHDSLRGVPVAVLGLAFKPGTDDVRESPALPVVEELVAEGADVRAYDPVARETARAALGEDGVTYADSMEACVEGAEAVLLLTSWEEFRRLPELLEDREDPPLVVDGRRFLDRDRVARYEGIGV